MGCGNTKEKIEDEMLKAKMARAELQYERQQQMKLLKDLDGTDYIPPVIPDYIMPHVVKNNQNTNVKRKTIQYIKPKTIRLRPRRSRSFAHKKKTFIDKEDTHSESKAKRKKSIKRKTLKN